MKLIVGLGNPGEKYSGNRHNIGFMAVDEIARGYGFAPWKKRFQGYTAEGQIGLEKCILLKPSTYMNESGRAVGEAMRFYKLPLGDVIVIHDEIDLKPGTIRVKKGGGNAGHNGLKSISAHAGNDYVRVRLGIDHPGDKALVANYVLQDFAKSDRDWLLPLLEGVARGMAKLVEGSEAAFLAEAARGRKRSAPAAKMNGTAPLPNGKAHVSSDEVIAAPAQPLAAQEASERPQEEATSEAPLAPQASEPVIDGALAAAAAHEVELFRAQATEPLFEIAPEDRAKEADAIRGPRRLSEPRLEEISTLSEGPSRRSFFTRWFRTRVRGGAK
jgi:peptidyl-tRNA hydrolase, PTH1 family